MATVTVAEGSPLAGQPLGALDATVVAVRQPEGPVEPLPDRDRPLAPGEMLYLVATPETIRRVDAAVRAAAPAPADDRPAAGSEMPADRRVDAATPVAGESGGPGPAAGTPDAFDPGDTDIAPVSEDETRLDETDGDLDDGPGGGDDSPGDGEDGEERAG
jgi:hypothetical protein